MQLWAVLLVVFIVLKLIGIIAWSWVWVLSPLWIGLILGIPFYIYYFVKIRKMKQEMNKFKK